VGAVLSTRNCSLCTASAAPVVVSTDEYSTVYCPSWPSFAFRCSTHAAVPVPPPHRELDGGCVPVRQKRLSISIA
jgi:hypothetical protein